MKKMIYLMFLFIFLINKTNAQVPENDVKTVKKVVKIGLKFYIEEKQVVTNYTELSNELLFKVEEEKENIDRENSKKNGIDQEILKNKAERIEFNKLLKSALNAGFQPVANTLEEKKRLDAIKLKLGI